MPGELTDPQRSLLTDWLGDWMVITDHSWPLQDTTVLHVRSGGRDFIVKASATSHHIEREIVAHRQVLGAFAGVVPTLVESSIDERMLLAEYLQGTLVEGSPAEDDPEVYRQAGSLLARLLVPGVESADYVGRQVESVRRMLSDAVGLVPSGQLRDLEARLDGVNDDPVPMSFTHGDYQPRNWLLHDGEVRVIDFGRAAQRHWTSELVRLDNQQFVRNSDLEDAFMQGLDRSFTALDERMLQLESLQQALGTVVWAHGIGDAGFEEHGRWMIDRLLEGDNSPG